MQFEDILNLAHRESDRAALLQLSEQYYMAMKASNPAVTSTVGGTSDRQESLLAQLMQAIDRQFINARHPIPSHIEVTQMVVNYWDRHVFNPKTDPPPLSPD